MESSEVSDFRQYILDASWNDAEASLVRLGVANEEGLWVNIASCVTMFCRSDVPLRCLQEARFLISQQKYLELLEARKTTAALQVLRNELAPLNVDPDQLHSLSR